MATKVRYTGPFEEVFVPEAGMAFERLKPYDVEDALAERMLKQDVWERHKPDKPEKDAPKGQEA